MPMLVEDAGPAGGGDRSLASRMLRAARLDATLYEEVEHDHGSMTQAILVVGLQALATALGSASIHRLLAAPAYLLLNLGTWFASSALIWVIGDRLMREHDRDTAYGEVLRPLGFAAAPGVLHVVRIVPFLGGLLSFLVALWQLAAGVVAVKAAFGYSETWRAVVVTVASWLVAAMLAGMFGWLFFGSILSAGAR